MRRIETRQLGIDQGSKVLFSDYEHDGKMWTGTGPRSTSASVTFSEPFCAPPCVSVGMSMWDMDQMTNPRADITARNVTCEGFEIVFRTWGDTRVARIRADWMAIGPVRSADDWELY